MSLYNKATLILPVSPAYKDGAIQSYRPLTSEGAFAFSRGSNLAATRVAPNGFIEKGRENLIPASNSFQSWFTINSDRTFNQSGYDGLNNATLIEALSSGVTGGLQPVAYPIGTQSGVNTFSVYAKAGTGDFLVSTVAFLPVLISVYFNLSNGTIYSDPSPSPDLITSKMENVGNGWYRCSLTQKRTINQVVISISNEGGVLTSIAGDNIFIQDVQLEQGLVATEYIGTITTTKTAGILEDLPRLDYSGGVTCPSILLEPSRTNLISQSEYVNGSPDVSNSTITSNAATSPQGLVNASKVVPNTSNTFHWFGQVFNSQSSGNYTQTIFAKADTYNHIFMVIRTDGGSERYGVKFNLSNGTFVDEIIFGTPSQTNYLIEDYSNGWYRCSISSNHSSGAVIALFGASLGGALSSINNEFAGDGTSGINVFGAQLETGSYPTSYIPSYGVSVTRAKDSCVNSTVATSTDFTIFFEAKDFCLINGTTGGSYDQVQFVFSATGGAYDSGGSYHIYANSLYYYDGTANTSFGQIFNNQTDSKFAIVKRGNKGIIYANGVKKTEITLPSGADAKVINWDTIDLTQSLQDAQGDIFGSKYQQILKFNSGLSDAELATLTTI